MNALRPSPSDRPLHGLWSLWEIMKRVHIDELLQHMWLFDAVNRWHQITTATPWPFRLLVRRADLLRRHRPAIKRELEGLASLCGELGFDACQISAERMLRNLTTAATYSDLKDTSKELEHRLVDQFYGRYCFVLLPNEADRVKSPRHGWEDIIARFSDCATDVEEAQYCFALERYAAAVFHSLQIVEIGLVELGRIIGAKDHQLGWNATTNRLEAIAKIKYPDRTAFQQEHHEFFEQIAATIEALKSAWRNKVSHASEKLVLLRTDFTPAIAEEILVATRSFMRRLATECPTSPDPDVSEA